MKIALDVYNVEFKFRWKWLNKYLNLNGAGWPKFKVPLPRTLEPLAFHLCRSLDLC